VTMVLERFITGGAWREVIPRDVRVGDILKRENLGGSTPTSYTFAVLHIQRNKIPDKGYVFKTIGVNPATIVDLPISVS